VTRFDPATLEILWRRLIATADEMATVLVRTSFSTVISAANDFACELMDADGRSLAHATRSMPVFNQTMPHVTRAVLDRYGDEIFPGDVFITNDPWLNAGHHPDIAVITPFFRGDRRIGIAASVAHAADIGGTLDINRAREAYEEGLLIPISHLYRQGELQEVVVDFVRENVRAADAVLGDLHAQVAANHSGAARVLELLDEYDLVDLTDLADAIQERSEHAMRAAITRLPDGTYRSRVTFDEFDGPLEIHCRIDVHGDELAVDFAGSAPQQPQGGLNCTFVYTRGQTSYGLKCVLLPDIPSNAGVYRPIAIEAPEGSILNARKPVAVQMRTRTGWYIHQALFAALAEVLPQQVMAPAGLLSAWIVYGPPTAEAPGFHSWFFNAGGMGAGAHTDGVSTCIYPSSASTVPVELFEVAVPMLVREKALITDSGGAGRQRGGLGQRVTLSLLPGFEGAATVSMWVHGRNFPPFGLHGGQAAQPTRVEVDGVEVRGADGRGRLSGLIVTDPDTTLTQCTAGGGGFGPPAERNPEQVLADLRNGYISAEQAVEVYGLPKRTHERRGPEQPQPGTSRCLGD
jgi:N-methylhydantoinase B/oxoprolinase/acetone carboxylase alpha subunit